MLWLAHLHVYPVLAGGALVAEGAGADHLGVAVDGDVAGRLVLAGVVLAQGVHLGSRQQIRIIRGANEEAGYESSDYDDYMYTWIPGIASLGGCTQSSECGQKSKIIV